MINSQQHLDVNSEQVMGLETLHTVRLCKKQFSGDDAMQNAFVAFVAVVLGFPLVLPAAIIFVSLDLLMWVVPKLPRIGWFVVKLHAWPIIWPIRKMYQARQANLQAAQSSEQRRESLRLGAISANEQQQRDDIRMRCQLLYDRHAVELADRFPRSQFWSYMETYLSHAQPLSIVERRGAALIEMIKECLVDVGKPLDDPRVEPETLGDVAAFFEEQRQQLKGSRSRVGN